MMMMIALLSCTHMIVFGRNNAWGGDGEKARNALVAAVRLEGGTHATHQATELGDSTDIVAVDAPSATQCERSAKRDGGRERERRGKRERHPHEAVVQRRTTGSV
uniref:Secreted protein n=1 Tax=Plectus sambesii TaxID=2011161 RepID=A0A914ULB2_9BILA